MPICRTIRQITLAALVTCIGARGASAQSVESFVLAPATKGSTATAVTDAPIYLLADSSRAPLRIAKAGSVLRVMGRTPEWVNVDFLDPQFGRRMGFVQTRHLEFDEVPTAPPAIAPAKPPTSVPAEQPKAERARAPRTERAPRNTSPSSARSPRGFIDLSGGYQVTKSTSKDSSSIRAYEEDGPVAVTYDVPSAPLFSVTGAARVFRRVYIGAAASRLTTNVPTSVSASMPHPSFFSQARDLTFTDGGVERQELAIHVQARILLPLSSRFDFSVFGGPSFLSVTQDTISGFTYNDPYPNTTVTLKGVQLEEGKKTKIGANAGADLFVRVANQVAIGGGARWTNASVDLPGFGGGSVSLKLGGLQASVGLRLSF